MPRKPEEINAGGKGKNDESMNKKRPRPLAMQSLAEHEFALLNGRVPSSKRPITSKRRG